MLRKMYFTKFFFVLVFTLFLRHFSYSQLLQLILVNKTGYELDSLVLDKIRIGKITKNDSIQILNCKELVLQNNLPLQILKATINGKRCVKQYPRCATKATSLRKGRFRFEIHAFETKEGIKLYFKK